MNFNEVLTVILSVLGLIATFISTYYTCKQYYDKKNQDFATKPIFEQKLNQDSHPKYKIHFIVNKQCNISYVKLQISRSPRVKNSTSRDQFSLLFTKTGLTIYSKFATLPINNKYITTI